MSKPVGPLLYCGMYFATIDLQLLLPTYSMAPLLSNLSFYKIIATLIIQRINHTNPATVIVRSSSLLGFFLIQFDSSSIVPCLVPLVEDTESYLANNCFAVSGTKENNLNGSSVNHIDPSPSPVEKFQQQSPISHVHQKSTNHIYRQWVRAWALR